MATPANQPSLKTTNQNSSIFDKFNPLTPSILSFYDIFYQSFLTTANSLPLNSLWIAFIERIPSDEIKRVVNGSTSIPSYENWKMSNTYDKAVYEGERKRSGLLIANSVKIVGDGFSVARQGTQNTGFIKGLIGQGRNEFPLLNIGFVENNVSFVDYTLRPWSIAVSHKSLKYTPLKTNIYIWHLSKMGSGKDLAKRKVTIYEDCVPVNIDDQEYNYTGGDVLIKRNVSFAFNRYKLENIDEALLRLIEAESSKGKLEVFFDQEINRLKQTLERTLGGSSFNEIAGNLADKALSFGTNLVGGTLENIATNTGGAVTTVVNETISSLEGGVQQEASNLTNSVNDAVNETINDLTGSEAGTNPATIHNPTRDVVTNSIEATTVQLEGAVPTYVEKNINQDDTPAGYRPEPPFSGAAGAPPAINTNVPVAQNDTVNGVEGVDYIDKGVAQDDNVTINTPVRYVKKSVNSNDYVKTTDKLPYRNKLIDKNDYVKTTDKLDYTDKNIPQNDYVSTNTKVSYKLITPNKDDFVKNDSKVAYTSITPDKNDFISKNSVIPFKFKPINQDDVLVNPDVHPKIVNPVGDFIKKPLDDSFSQIPIDQDDVPNFNKPLDK